MRTREIGCCIVCCAKQNASFEISIAGIKNETGKVMDNSQRKITIYTPDSMEKPVSFR